MLIDGGTEIQTLNLVRALVSGGYSVVTACYYEYDVSMVQQYQEAGSTVELLAADGVRRRGKEEWKHLYHGLKHCVQAYQPMLAHVQYMAPGATPCIILKWLGVKHVIATAHTDSRIYRSLCLLHLVQRHLLDVFTCITQRAEKEFFGAACLYTQDTELKRHAHVTIYNTLSDYIPLRSERRRWSGGTVVGVVGRMEMIKGMDYVIPAFAHLRAKMPRVRLLVVGEGSLRPHMMQQASEWGVTGAVEWVDRQSQAKLAALYDRIDVCWMPSRSEGFGLSALEAMARGCPVVVSDVGGLPELVQDGVSGRLVPIGDIEALSTATGELLEDEEAWQSLSDAARERAGEFSMARFASLVNSLYRKVLSCSC